ncbi:flavin reductase family protein [Planococcus shenhongbingii]|uniref:Flavin reductase family protein n=1 Tax=Planococcus shenhongbingii TaxID=3058398 RepID=A0ABT8NFA3_9BACL|nr:flavin reductase family protein [Planococcus sp. N017]MDN7246352.1 flavin reductase family protein [Planococcus sp. N017]
MDSREFRNAMGKFATGVTVISTDVKGTYHGMTANGFMSISLDPALVAVSIGEKAQTLQLIKESGRFGVSILTKDQLHISKQFAGQVPSDVAFHFDVANGFPLIKEALVQIVCEVEQEIVAGDHTVFIGRVEKMVARNGEPLLFSCGKYAELDPQYAVL